MKVGIATVQVPFIRGGAEVHAESLRRELVKRGVEADVITTPFKWYPPERLLDCMLMARLVDMEEVGGVKIDRVVALKFPAYYVPHPAKTGWILHQHRQAYELYETPFGDLHRTETGRRVAREIRKWDDRFLGDLKPLFANSENVAQRLKAYNNIAAEPLYHPPGNHELFRCDAYGDFVLCPGRLESIKRQHLIVEAMKHAPEGLRLVLIGLCHGDYGRRLTEEISKGERENRVAMLGPISEEKKIELYAHCLAVYNGAYEEDYGYVTLEAFLSAKPVITHTDSGDPLEFVLHGTNGYVVPPDPVRIGECLHRLHESRQRAKRMGAEGRKTLEEKRISWDHVVERLLS